MRNDHRKALGRKGEEIAVEYLKNHGYTVLLQNYRSPHGEIDIIAEENNVLVFVEVKLRSNKKFGEVEDQIPHKKWQRLRDTAYCYIEERKLWDRDCRFDLITLLRSQELFQINHIKNAYEGS